MLAMKLRTPLVFACLLSLVLHPSQAAIWSLAEVNVDADAPELVWHVANAPGEDTASNVTAAVVTDAGEQAPASPSLRDAPSLPVVAHGSTEPAESSGAATVVSSTPSDADDSSSRSEHAATDLVGWFSSMNLAQQGALTDGATTTVAIAGKLAVERNPLIGNSILGILVATALKYRLGSYVENIAEPERTKSIAILGGLWGGATVNNLLVIAQVSSPVPLITGVIAGVWLWLTHSEKTGLR